jgi:hypothetical protein
MIDLSHVFEVTIAHSIGMTTILAAFLSVPPGLAAACYLAFSLAALQPTWNSITYVHAKRPAVSRQRLEKINA